MKSRLPKLFLMLFLLSGWMEGSARKQPGKEMLLPMAQTERVYTEETLEVLLCLVLVIGKLMIDAYKEHKANQYADKVVRRYKGD